MIFFVMMVVSPFFSVVVNVCVLMGFEPGTPTLTSLLTLVLVLVLPEADDFVDFVP
jgi:hypothetical protein